MKLWLRILAMLMVACMMLGCLAGCEKDDDRDRDDDDDDGCEDWDDENEDDGDNDGLHWDDDGKGNDVGKVREVYYITQWAVEDNRYGGSTLTVTFEYNEEYTGGTAVYDASYYSGPAEFTFTCDEDGHITSLCGTVDGNELNYLLEYDAEGRKVYYAYNTENGWEAWEYDEKGNLVEYQNRFTDFLEVVVYTYDENGNLIQETNTLYDHTGYELGVEEIVYTLDGEGKIVEAAYYEDGDYIKDILFYYDGEDRMMRVEEYPGSYIPYVYEYEWLDDLSHSVFSYDQDGYKVQEEYVNYWEDGRFESHYVYSCPTETSLSVELTEECTWMCVERPAN